MAHHELLLQMAFGLSVLPLIPLFSANILSSPLLGLVVPLTVKGRLIGQFRCSILSMVGTASGVNIIYSYLRRSCSL